MGWFGGDLVLMLGFDSSLGRLSPSAKGEVVTRLTPAINRLEMVFAGATVTFGLLLVYAMTGGDLAMLSPSSSWGLAVSVGATLGFIAFLLEVAVHSPAVRRVVAITAERGTEGQPSSTDEASRYERRAEVAETGILLLLFLVFTCMVTAGQI